MQTLFDVYAQQVVIGGIAFIGAAVIMTFALIQRRAAKRLESEVRQIKNGQNRQVELLAEYKRLAGEFWLKSAHLSKKRADFLWAPALNAFNAAVGWMVDPQKYDKDQLPAAVDLTTAVERAREAVAILPQLKQVA